jgi:hypothetical protein
MLRMRRLILRTTCFTSIGLCAVLCALLLLQAARIVPPLGWGWGDGARTRAYSVEVAGPLVFRTASAMKPAPPGNYTYAVQSLARSEAAGVSYHRWNMTAGRAPQAPVLGTFAEVRVAAAWPLLLSLALAALCVTPLVKQRRPPRDGRRCAKCGYDLRATPDRCPECGLAAAPPPAAGDVDGLSPVATDRFAG